jgi:hypothetical protein
MPTLIIGLVVLVIAIAVGSWVVGERRRRALAAWGLANGLAFSRERLPGLDARYPQFECLCRGENRYAYNTLTGAWKGRPCLAFDYHYETHSTNSKGNRQTHHHHFSAAILDSRCPLKPLFIRPERFFDKITEFFGFDDIDFESAEFSRAFFVKAPDRKWAYDVIHPRTMEFLLAMPRFNLQLAPAGAIASRGSPFRPPEFAQAVELAAGILDRLPAYVVEQQTAGAGLKPRGA